MRSSPWKPVLGLVVAGWAGFAGYAILASGNKERVGADGCPASGAKATTLFYIDTTDGFDVERTQAAVVRVAGDIAEGGRLAVVLIDGDPGHAAKPRLARCKPRDPRLVDARVENPRLVEQAYERDFLVPLRAAVAALAGTPEARESNIIAGLEASLWSDAWRQTKGPRTLVLYSNLLEHGSYASHLRGPMTDVCAVLAAPLGERLKAHPWKDVRVQLLYQRDARFADRQGASHLAWWANLFTELGVTELRESERALTRSGVSCAAKASAAGPAIINDSGIKAKKRTATTKE